MFTTVDLEEGLMRNVEVVARCMGRGKLAEVECEKIQMRLLSRRGRRRELV